MDLEQETILSEKNGLKFIKAKQNHYQLIFSMQNNNIVLSKIMDFNLVKLIYDLNSDVYEKINIFNINDNEAIVVILMKHFFEDLGLPQRFTYLHIEKIVNENNITFISKSIRTHRPTNMPKEAELMPILEMTSTCHVITPHNIDFHFNIIFDTELNIQPFTEKIVGLILNKIFIRVKQFIESVTL
jgi:hypothetical protein